MFECLSGSQLYRQARRGWEGEQSRLKAQLVQRRTGFGEDGGPEVSMINALKTH